MGFLNFLKKGKKEKEHIDESLDVPPTPPHIKGGFHKEELPPFEFKEGKPMSVSEGKLPELPEEKEAGLEFLGFPPLEGGPEFMPKPPIERSVKEVPLPKKELMKPELEEPFGEKLGAVVTEGKKPSKKLVSKGSIYVELSEFKEILGDVSKIKNDLKKSGEFLHDLIKSKEDKSKDFEKWHSIMRDIQKKLIFIEKNLFKGD